MRRLEPCLLSLLLAWTVSMLACTRSDGGSKPHAKRAEQTIRDASVAAAPAAPLRESKDAGGPRVTSAEHGAALYGKMCAVCHGAEGQGYQADEATALAHPDFLGSVTDEYLSFAIRVGRSGTKMSAWHADQGGPLLDDDVADLVAHVRGWETQPTLALDERPPSGNVARGKALFKRTCARCHGAEGRYVRILNRQLLLHATPGFLRHAIRRGRTGTEMPAYEKKLGERGVEDVVTYLASLPAWLAPGEQHRTASPPSIPLGPVPLHPKGRAPRGFKKYPGMTSVDVVGPQLSRGARMALLDARPPSDYVRGHIAGAVSVPFYDPSPYLAKLPKDAWLVCYCGCPHAESGTLAGKLREAGFTKVTVLDEGLDAWREKGFPMRSGVEP